MLLQFGETTVRGVPILGELNVLANRTAILVVVTLAKPSRIVFVAT